jgi:hypothetical protein
VAHSPQNFWVSGLSVLHLGHSTPIVPSINWAKGYQFMRRESN